MFVEVVVDIPSAQVNHTFEYHVPKEWQDALELGMRVEVPFGARKLMAIVVAIKDQVEFEGTIRDITTVLDYQSYLNEELIKLSQELSYRLQCYWISVLQAMLPSMLRVKYRTVFRILDNDPLLSKVDLSDTDQVPEIAKHDLETFLTPNQIKQLIRLNKIRIEYRVLDQKTQKKLHYISPDSYDPDILKKNIQTLSKRSKKQIQVLQYLQNQPPKSPLTIQELSKAAEVSKSVIDRLIDQEILAVYEADEYRRPDQIDQIEVNHARPLLTSQQLAFDQLAECLDQKKAQTFLLEGVTGSGKTEVYLQLIAKVLSESRTAMLLVPEISLTPQMVRQVVGRFGKGVAVLHSGLSVSERYDEWRRIINQEAKIVVGARSSVFAPLKNIGLIIIDEEHETTYKQNENPRYHARDVAQWRSKYHGACLLLGSATPSLESRARAEVNRYQLIHMDQRINQRPLPPVEIIDMRQNLEEQGQLILSQKLEKAIQQRIDREEQVVLLLNRRGYASYIMCRSCGNVLQCPHCDISLTYHKFDQSLKCHYCDYHTPLIRRCPRCGSDHLRKQGMGTQKVFENLKELFPNTPVIRMDNDTTRRKGAHARLLNEFSNQKSAILLGTQMIAKGLDFENVTLVGVINADTGLNLPDFRAGEKTFQLLTQVAGRTGRGRLQGQVIIQTYNPDNYVIQFASQHNYEEFFYYEMKRRHLGKYPPYYYTCSIKLSSKNRAKAQQAIFEVKLELQEILKGKEVIILGPSNSGIERINDYYHFMLLLKFKERDILSKYQFETLDSQLAEKKGIYIQIDHEPQYFI